MKSFLIWLGMTLVVVAGSHWLGVVVRDNLIAR
jgi:hypothetical protein